MSVDRLPNLERRPKVHLGTSYELSRARGEADEGVGLARIVQNYVIEKVESVYSRGFYGSDENVHHLEFFPDYIMAGGVAVLVQSAKELRLGFVVCGKERSGRKFNRLLAFPEGDAYRIDDENHFLSLISEPVYGNNGEISRYELFQGAESSERGGVVVGAKYDELGLETKILSLNEVVKDTQDPYLTNKDEKVHVNPAYEIVRELVPLIVEWTNEQSSAEAVSESLEDGDR